ncbi:hypothetical protein QBC33DRAFT_552409 [Phialemonium atrogriseum]|uniref:Secreted protein n=1 Tax=Phialemonium atrogriseum TaxID=1093897 RepID=A0AAJ0BSJ3_9PEZI|nr:uncharacterized protein QBC33DRAFT_552409 [Phialemonium atrogriseum]KAK1762247.1 hypothetical protein QBC33DRAFT_552409 [Phialemonium atrogriseum]
MLRSQVAVAVAVAVAPSVAVCRCRAEEVIHSFHAPAHPCRFRHSPAMWFSAPEACHCASPSGICICLLLIPAGTSEGENEGADTGIRHSSLVGCWWNRLPMPTRFHDQSCSAAPTGWPHTS